jgi:hypothetical protein
MANIMYGVDSPVPAVTMQEILGGNTLTGVAPDGTDSLETDFRGRYRKFTRGTVAGEFPAPDKTGMKVQDIYWDLSATVAPNVAIYLVDDDDVEYLVNTTNVDSGHFTNTNQGFFVPPTFKVRVKSDQAIGETATSEDTGVTGDGVTATYPIALANINVIPGTVSIVAGSVTFTDPGLVGILVGAGAGGGSGTIDYLTGDVSITLNTPSDFNAVNALATYDYGNGRVILCQSDGWDQTVFSEVTTLGKSNLVPPMGA